jgi:hypothetical protein
MLVARIALGPTEECFQREGRVACLCQAELYFLAACKKNKMLMKNRAAASWAVSLAKKA